eukprot:6177959-Pleurochrysis_carterae.AAC.3
MKCANVLVSHAFPDRDRCSQPECPYDDDTNSHRLQGRVSSWNGYVEGAHGSLTSLCPALFAACTCALTRPSLPVRAGADGRGGGSKRQAVGRGAHAASAACGWPLSPNSFTSQSSRRRAVSLLLSSSEHCGLGQHAEHACPSKTARVRISVPAAMRPAAAIHHAWVSPGTAVTSFDVFALSSLRPLVATRLRRGCAAAVVVLLLLPLCLFRCASSALAS